MASDSTANPVIVSRKSAEIFFAHSFEIFLPRFHLPNVPGSAPSFWLIPAGLRYATNLCG